MFTVRNGLTWVHFHILRPLFSGYTKNGFLYTIFLLTVRNGLTWEDLSPFSALKYRGPDTLQKQIQFWLLITYPTKHLRPLFFHIYPHWDHLFHVTEKMVSLAPFFCFHSKKWSHLSPFPYFETIFFTLYQKWFHLHHFFYSQ